MVRVNCTSIPNELFESEFFRRAKGAFTRNLSLSVEYQFYDLKREDYPINGSLQPASTGIVIGVQYAL